MKTIETETKRIGQTAELQQGLLRGQVTVRAVRQVYGRLEYLVETDRAEKQWVRDSSLTFNSR